PGYPLLRVRADGLSQQQFFVGEHRLSKQIWPIVLASNSSSIKNEIFDKNKFDVEITTAVVKNTTPLIFNQNDVSHIVIDYDTGLLTNILQNIQQLAALDR